MTPFWCHKGWRHLNYTSFRLVWTSLAKCLFSAAVCYSFSMTQIQSPTGLKSPRQASQCVEFKRGLRPKLCWIPFHGPDTVTTLPNEDILRCTMSICGAAGRIFYSMTWRSYEMLKLRWRTSRRNKTKYIHCYGSFDLFMLLILIKKTKSIRLTLLLR